MIMIEMLTNEWYVSDIACEVTYEIVSNTEHICVYMSMLMCQCMMIMNDAWLLSLMYEHMYMWIHDQSMNDCIFGFMICK